MIHSEYDYILRQLPSSYNKTKLIEDNVEKGGMIVAQLFDLYVDLLLIPLLEFVDNLMERIIYPEGFTISPAKLIRESKKLNVEHIKISVPTTTLSLGHPVILQVITLKNELEKVSDIKYKGTKPLIVHLFNRSKEIINQIFQLLTRDKIVPARNMIDIQLLNKFTPYVTELNKLFDLILPIFESLNNAQKGVKVGTVNSEALLNLDTIAAVSKDIYINIIKDSIALKDYFTWKHDLSNGLGEDKKSDDNTEFSTFVHRRKTLLNLNNRRIF